MKRPVRSIKNQYLGISAHLHSYWQNQYGWHEFHTAHIVDLTRMLKTQLMHIGYTATIQDSLQIRRSDLEERRPESDVAIYDTDPVRALMSPGVSPVDTAELVIAMPDILVDYDEELSEYRAIGIYKSQSRREEVNLVAWLELLSPSNKLYKDDLAAYRRKWFHLLGSGVVFIELDYLHESPPTISKIPNYAAWRKRQPFLPNAHPYHIVVIDPRPEFDEGQAHTYQFDVDESIPTVPIPLSADDRLPFDFGAPYHKTIAETFFAYEQVDYSQLPLNFEHYNQQDQRHIAMRMLAILEAVEQDVDLETGPFQTSTVSLERALAQIKMLTNA